LPGWKKRIGLGALVLLLAIQIIPVNRANPPVDPSRTIYATQAVPPEVTEVFERSCNNCHSDQTKWPWYSYVAPVSWIIARDVHRARRNLNFSQWGSYSPKKRAERLEGICEQLVNGDMPDPKYMLFHRSARVTKRQRSVVCDWTDEAREY
jgi:Haem-binding domain